MGSIDSNDPPARFDAALAEVDLKGQRQFDRLLEAPGLYREVPTRSWHSAADLHLPAGR
ncbi:MAG: hypothetical protein Q7V88_13700 [Actinomycetota bacterium]|nr:hypothetical protein [Actinomycetota bacterium]